MLLDVVSRYFFELISERVDDSSSDEYESPIFTNTALYEVWRKFDRKEILFPADMSFFSLITHELGTNILYSKGVHDYYWQALLKRLSAREDAKALFKRIRDSFVEKIRSVLDKNFSIKVEHYEKLGILNSFKGPLDAISLYIMRTISRDDPRTLKAEYLKEFLEILHTSLNKFLNLHKNRLLDGKLRSFTEAILVQLEGFGKKSLLRPILKAATTLEMSNQIEFLGSLLLSLRSSKRKVRYIKDHGRKGAITSEPKTTHSPILYSFKGGPIVCELQKLTASEDPARSDLVIHFGSYVDIANLMHHYGLDVEAKRVEVAKALKAILTFKSFTIPVLTDIHHQEDFESFIYQMALTIGGTEAIRNPATLIHTMMLLDLIENKVEGYKTWKNALEEKFPMAIAGEDVVPCARYLHKTYGIAQTFKYRYPGKPSGSSKAKATLGEPTESDIAKINKLLARENTLVQDWLKCKLKVTDLHITEEARKNQLQKILDACKDWFPGIVVGSELRAKTVFRELMLATPIKEEPAFAAS